MGVWNELVRWCGVILAILVGMTACAEKSDSGAVGPKAAESLVQHVEKGLGSLEWDKLKELGLAPPYDLAKKEFEKAYGIQVAGMEWVETGHGRDLHGIVRLTGSSQDPRSGLWLTEVVRLEFVRVGGRGPWKLITFRGQVEDYFSNAIPGEEIRALPKPLQDYLKTAFETIPSKDLKSSGG